MLHVRVWVVVVATSSFGACWVWAELPLPDTIIYGTIDLGGGPVGSGSVVGRVVRGAQEQLEVPGEFINYQGVPYYVLRIPLESSIGAPGTGRPAAREADVLQDLVLDGQVIGMPRESLGAAKIKEFTIGDKPTPGLSFVRGDCDLNGMLQLTDAVNLLGFLFLGREPPGCKKACDGDDNGNLQITDGVKILGFLFLGQAEPPLPYPGCGRDPTPDVLECARTAVQCGGGGQEGGGGGGAAGPGERGAKGRGPAGPIAPRKPEDPLSPGLPPEQHESLDTTAVRVPRREDASARSWVVSPAEIEFGVVVPQAPRTFTLTNPTSGTVDVTIASKTPGFTVLPTAFALPGGGSYVVFVDGVEGAERGPAPPAGGVVELRTGGMPLAEVRLRWEPDPTAGQPWIRLGRVTVCEGWQDAVAVPIIAAGLAGRLTLDIELDKTAFGLSSAEAAAGCRWTQEPAGAPHTWRGVMEVSNRGTTEGAIGTLVFEPRSALGAGTYPVRAIAAWIDGSPVAVSHGEICSQRPWLDLDADGFASLAVDVVILERFQAGLSSLWPDDWSWPGPSKAFLLERITERAPCFDMDGSGGLDPQDVRAIVKALAGFVPDDPNTAARASNLHVQVCAATTMARSLPYFPLVALDGCIDKLRGEGSVRVVLEEPAGAGANLIEVELLYEPGSCSLGHARLAPGLKEECDLSFQAQPEQGLMRILARGRNGIDIPLSRVAGVLATLNASIPGPASAPFGELTVAYGRASRGREEAQLLGGALPIARWAARACAPDACARLPPRSVTEDLLSLLEHLFLGSACPPCFSRLDEDGDGALSIRDAIMLARRR